MKDMKKTTLMAIHEELHLLALMRELFDDKETSISWPTVMEADGCVTGMISLAYTLGIITKEEMETLNFEKVDTLCGKYSAEDYEK